MIDAESATPRRRAVISTARAPGREGWDTTPTPSSRHGPSPSTTSSSDRASGGVPADRLAVRRLQARSSWPRMGARRSPTTAGAFGIPHLAPDPVGNPTDQLEFGPLLLGGDRGAHGPRSEAALGTQRQLLKRLDPGRFLDPTLDHRLLLDRSRLGGQQAQDGDGPWGDASQRLEAPGTLAVVLQEQDVHPEFWEELLGDDAIAATGVPAAGGVASADVEGAGDALEAVEERAVELDVEGQLGLQVVAPGLKHPTVVTVTQRAVVGRVELHVVAAELDQSGQHRSLVVTNSDEELLTRRVGGRGVLSIPEPPVVAGGGHAVLGANPSVAGKEGVLLGQVTTGSDRAHHRGVSPCRLDDRLGEGAVLIVPGQAGAALAGLESVQRLGGDGPSAPPHLAVGDHVQPRRLLEPDGVQHRGVLQLPDPFARDPARLELPPSGEQLGRAEKAADGLGPRDRSWRGHRRASSLRVWERASHSARISSTIACGWPARNGNGGGPSSGRGGRDRITGRWTRWLRAGSRIVPLGSRPSLTASISSNIRLRIMRMPRSLSPRCSLVRSATRPCPTQATKSWFMMWESIHRPVRGSSTGAVQQGMRSCSNGSSPGRGSMNQPTLRVFSSSMGTRHSKWPV